MLLPEPEHAPVAIQNACKVAEVRCSSCHTLERLVTTQRRDRAGWEQQVTRMRRMPASGISTTDADVIIECMVYREENGLRAGFGYSHSSQMSASLW